MLEAKGIRFAYGGSEVLRGVDAAFSNGRMTAIVGPNGSGKTTLLKVLSGITRPSHGHALLSGRDVYLIPHRERARLIAVVPQQAHIAFPFTAREVVLMGRNAYVPMLGSEKESDFEAVRQAIEEAGVAEYADRPITELSGGEAQRVIAARALAQCASVMLLDEPVANLDIKHQAGLLELFRRKAEEGAAVVCVLHDLNMAARYAHDILVLSRGRAVRFGTPGEALELGLLEEVYEQKLVAIEGPHGRFIMPG